jgi:tellurite resistance-related uncharacterized protein
MKSLPQGLHPYKTTPVFTRDTVPPGLLRDHATKAGVWGLVHVLSGAVVYRISDPFEEHRLGPGDAGVVEPQVLHSVDLSDDAAFYVEFWKAGAAGT